MMRRNVIPTLAVALALSAGGVGAQLSRPLDEASLSALKWRSLGPANMGGRVTDVEGVPGPSKTFYVASAAGGIWKTTNNGITFRPIFDMKRVAAMGDLAIAPSDTLQIWAGTGEEDSRNSISPGAGIYKSTDGGMTWKLMGLEKTQVIARILVHPTNPDIVYVAALGHIWDANPERGLYRTRDGGQTWKLVKFVSDKAGFVDIVMDPRNPDVLFASSWERVRGPYFLNSGGPGSKLWKSTDGGDSWSEVVGNGFPTALKGRIGLAISLSDPDVMYALVEAKKEEDGSGGTGLYRSDDAGATWRKVSDKDSRPFYYSQVRVDPQDPNRVYFSSTPVQFSTDGGKTVGTTTNGIHVDQHAMWIDPHDGDRIVVGNDGGVDISFDRGGNWEYLNVIPIGQFYHVSYNMDVPYRVCGGLQDNGTWCAPSRVANGRLGRYHWATIGGGDGFYSVQDPVDPTIAWVESQGGNIGRVNTATGERKSLGKPDWQDVWRPYQDTIVTLLDQGVSEDDPRIQDLRKRASADSAAYALRYNWNTPFFQSVHNRSVLYVGANRVLKSTDWGDHLKPISPDLSYADPEKVRVSTKTTGGITPDVTGAETYATVVALAESPLHQGWLFAGTDDGRVWTTRDDGASWQELTDHFKGVPKGTWVSRIEPSHFDPDRFYVTFDGHRTNDFTPYVYVTEDGGRHFRSIVADLPTGGPDFVHVIREDPHNENLLFVGTDVGVYVSTNRGGSWQRFMTSLPTVPVRDLEIHPRDRELIAATHGRSIWIVDIAPLEQLTDAVVAGGVTLFQPKPAFQWGQEPRGGESYGQHWFSRPTPGPVAEISYYIGDDVAKALKEAQPKPKAGMKQPSDTAARRMRAGARAGEGGRGGGAPGQGGRAAMMRRMQRGPRVQMTITGPDGKVVRTLSGPATAGLHTITWNYRGAPPKPKPLSPSERRDSIQIATRAKEVADSLIKAGWKEAPLKRMLGLFTGETSREEMFRQFQGGGGRSRDPEAFQERPGERMGGAAAGGFDFNQMRELAGLIRPGAGLGSLFRGRGRGQAPLAGPGAYTVTLKVGERTFTQGLSVERRGNVTGNNTPFREDVIH